MKEKLEQILNAINDVIEIDTSGGAHIYIARDAVESAIACCNRRAVQERLEYNNTISKHIL